jgi:outer membrane scaffolding protein for murein synthesis (MipA/OmpV family)
MVTVGARMRLRPPYEGANSMRVVGVGSLVFRPVNKPDRYTAPDAGSFFDLISNKWFSAGPVLNLRASRATHGRFAGMHRIPIAIEPGVFAGVWPADWLNVWGQVRRGVAGHHGWVEDGGIDVIRTGPRWSFSVGPRIGFGDSDYMDTYFGVTPQEAAVSGLVHTPYEPGGGLRYTGGAASASYRLSRHWTTLMDLTVERLASKPQGSPIVQVLGGRNQLIVGAGFTYTFGPVRF